MNGKIILLVEDNPDDEVLTLRAFKKNNLETEVVVAHDGAEALAYLFGTGAYKQRDLTVNPSVILLDLKLPKVDGIEVLRRLRAETRTKTIPVIILTSSREERDIVDCYFLGANSYIRKQVDFEKFTQVIGLIGRYWLLLNELPTMDAILTYEQLSNTGGNR